jgi:hypothetical protein
MEQETTPDMRVDGPVVAADWALMSKHPGRPMGYQVLAASTDRAAASRVIWSGVTGTPRGEQAGLPEQLPWLTFSPGAEGGEPVTAVIQFSWSGAMDGTGQPIIPARMLSIAWSRAAALGLKYSSLAWAAARLGWEAVDGPPQQLDADGRVWLDVPELSVDWLVSGVHNCGFDWVAAVAAVLLDGDRVVITADAEHYPDPVDRPAILDAICALLPYGCRAWVSAATWGSERAEHSVLLTFGQRAAGTQREIRWGVVPQEPPRTGVGREYLAELHELHADGTSISALLDHLAAERGALPPARPDLALRHLRELRLAAAIHRQILVGEGRPDQVVSFLDSRGGWATLTEPELRDFIGFLADTAVSRQPDAPVAADGLLRHWTPAVTQVLAGQVGGRPWDDDAHRVGGWVALAAQASGDPDAPETLLAVATRCPVRGSARDLVMFLRQPPAGVEPRSRQVLAALVEQPRLGVEFVRQAVRAARGPTADDDVHAELDRLAELVPAGRPHWLWPLLAAADRRRSHEPQPADLAVLEQADPAGWRLLLEIAKRCQSGDETLGLAWPWLVKTLGSPNGDAARLLMELPVATAESMARIDVLVLVHAQEMPFLGASDHRDTGRYTAALRAAWEDVRLDTAWAATLVDLLACRGLDQDKSRQLLMSIVDTVVPAARGYAASVLAKALRRNLVNYLLFEYPDTWVQEISCQPGLERFGPLRTLAWAAIAETGPSQMADLCLAAYAARASTDELVTVLLPWLAQDRPGQAERVDRLAHRLALAHQRKDLAFRIVDEVLDGVYGRPLRDRFRTLIGEQARWYASIEERSGRYYSEAAAPAARGMQLGWDHR